MMDCELLQIDKKAMMLAPPGIHILGTVRSVSAGTEHPIRSGPALGAVLSRAIPRKITWPERPDDPLRPGHLRGGVPFSGVGAITKQERLDLGNTVQTCTAWPTKLFRSNPETWIIRFPPG
jgi:hypothetical protein